MYCGALCLGCVCRCAESHLASSRLEPWEEAAAELNETTARLHKWSLGFSSGPAWRETYIRSSFVWAEKLEGEGKAGVGHGMFSQNCMWEDVAAPGEVSALVQLELDLIGRRTCRAALGLTVSSAFTAMRAPKLRTDLWGVFLSLKRSLLKLSNIFVQLSHPDW